ncbi:MAG: cytochrome c biogenesis protein ResB [Candidatus Neomarinimicrobiota bacterium]
MKNTLIRMFQILTLTLLVFLAVSTFMPLKSEPGFLYLNRFYDSPLNLFLWLMLLVILFVAVLFKGIRSSRQKILHFLLAVIIILFIVDKSSNERFFIKIREGDTFMLNEVITSENEIYTVGIKLTRFEIDVHDDKETPKAYRSYLQMNDEDLVLEVNKPLALGSYRLYQSAFERDYYFDLKIGEDEFKITFGDTVISSYGNIVLQDYDPRNRHFRLLVAGEVRWLPLKTEVLYDNSKWQISPSGEIYTSVIEVVEVKGLFWLLLAGILYLLVMGWSFWKPKKQHREEV